MDFGIVFNAVKRALEFLPENERPSFDEFLRKTKLAMLDIPTVKQEFNGYKLSPIFTAESARLQYENWNPNREDVLISTFPKTGTTWVIEILRHIFFKGNKKEAEIASCLTHPLTYLESLDLSLYNAYKKLPLSRRFYATHMASECVNMKKVLQSGCKIVCILRNPKDQLVSSYHFKKQMPFMRQGELAELHPPDWNGFFNKYISGQQPVFCKDGKIYPHHILSWYAYRNHENVKFMYYEDFKRNTTERIKELAQFVGSERTDEEIAEIAKDTSINKMKNESLAEPILFRKGVVGDWKSTFTVAQSELMDEKTNEVLLNTDISFIYE